LGQGEGFTITGIELVSKATVAGLEDAKFQEIAAETKKNCPCPRRWRVPPSHSRPVSPAEW
jgi:organic hydroperoxide reductase OsmC/OhrA